MNARQGINIALDTGGVAVSDEVAIDLDLELVKQASAAKVATPGPPPEIREYAAGPARGGVCSRGRMG